MPAEELEVTNTGVHLPSSPIGANSPMRFGQARLGSPSEKSFANEFIHGFVIVLEKKLERIRR